MMICSPKYVTKQFTIKLNMEQSNISIAISDDNIEDQTEDNTMKKTHYLFLANYKNSEIATVIDEWVHDEEHREMLKEKLIDGASFEEIAFDHSISTTSAKKTIYSYENEIEKGLAKR